MCMLFSHAFRLLSIEPVEALCLGEFVDFGSRNGSKEFLYLEFLYS